jgi:superfamily II DNA or RNA helicase
LSRGDRRSLFSVATTGSVIYKVDVQMLIKRKFVAQPHIQMVECTQNSSCGTWRTSYTTNIVKSKKRNAIVANVAAFAPKPGLVFVREKKHGKELEKLLKDKGISCEFVWGEKKTHEREAAIQRLRDGELDIIVCSVVFQTGTDIPEVQSMVIACGGKSEIGTLQRIGRGMRILRDSEGNVIKDHFYVFDILDKALRGPGRGNRWNVKHSQERFKTYRSVGHEVTVKEGM